MKMQALGESSGVAVDCDSDCAQLILVQKNLRNLPPENIKRHASYVELLDLSYNRIKDLSWLAEFEQLRHLVLDNNHLHEAQLRTLTQPLPQLEVLMLNKNERPAHNYAAHPKTFPQPGVPQPARQSHLPGRLRIAAIFDLFAVRLSVLQQLHCAVA
ncbi:uncharacterized protein LOC115621554 isoform X2 [Scaptodrosophila lebanonensis]|uniref:Uncharacterized protein LOC115621554 isoform X2 n=1 Tax=Drosophila lebanonensis TaxID=7225 RepID=A0A6J2T4Z1_DROLE|nr:uncharacterized protein LOC115621554 isoform X2 [Scaptodrosophila lebanonensis]